MDEFVMKLEDLHRIDPYTPSYDVEFVMRAPNGKIAHLSLRFRPHGWFRRLIAKAALWFSGIELIYREE